LSGFSSFIKLAAYILFNTQVIPVWHKFKVESLSWCVQTPSLKTDSK